MKVLNIEVGIGARLDRPAVVQFAKIRACRLSCAELGWERRVNPERNRTTLTATRW